jgi:WhiB family redox-sensing transcriptional regulator
MGLTYDDDVPSTGHSSYGFESEPEPTWQDKGLCAQTDPEAFFPEKGGSTREAKKICGRCEVKDECLDYALEHDERFGIWGGLSERERRALKRTRPTAETVTNCRNCDSKTVVQAKFGPEKLYCSQSCREAAALKRRSVA